MTNKPRYRYDWKTGRARSKHGFVVSRKSDPGILRVVSEAEVKIDEIRRSSENSGTDGQRAACAMHIEGVIIDAHLKIASINFGNAFSRGAIASSA